MITRSVITLVEAHSKQIGYDVAVVELSASPYKRPFCLLPSFPSNIALSRSSSPSIVRNRYECILLIMESVASAEKNLLDIFGVEVNRYNAKTERDIL